MTVQPKNPLVRISYETTGLDVRRDVLIEVGVVITDTDLRTVDKGVDVLVKPPAAMPENMNNFMRNVHTTSGLLDELEGGLSFEEATGQVLDYIRRSVLEQGKALLAGSSIGIDRMFLEVYMSSAIGHLHYCIVDVSSIGGLAERWYRRAFENVPVKHGGHRVFADTLESTQGLGYYRRIFLSAESVTRAQVKAAFKDALALEISVIGEDEQPCVNQDEEL